MKKILYIIAIAASAFLIACTGSAPEQTSPAGNQYRAGVDAFYAMFSSGNYDGLDTLVDASFMTHTPPPGMEIEPGIEGLKIMMKGGYDMAPDSKLSILDYAEEGDMVYIHYNWKGTNTGSMGPGMPATNKTFDINGIDILKMYNGKCTEHWGYNEESKMMTQLGMMPVPGDTAAHQ